MLRLTSPLHTMGSLPDNLGLNMEIFFIKKSQIADFFAFYTIWELELEFGNLI